MKEPDPYVCKNICSLFSSSYDDLSPEAKRQMMQMQRAEAADLNSPCQYVQVPMVGLDTVLLLLPGVVVIH